MVLGGFWVGRDLGGMGRANRTQWGDRVSGMIRVIGVSGEIGVAGRVGVMGESLSDRK